MAVILPSLPLFPNPPGIRTPDTSFNKVFIFSGFIFSESILFKLSPWYIVSDKYILFHDFV